MHIRRYIAALEFVNEERAARGLDPLNRLPEGTPGNGSDCVIARAIPGVLVSPVSLVSRSSLKSSKSLPQEVSRFVLSFDGQPHRRHKTKDPALLVDGGIDDEKGCLVSV